MGFLERLSLNEGVHGQGSLAYADLQQALRYPQCQALCRADLKS